MPPSAYRPIAYDSHDQLRTHLDDFLAAYKFARRLKTLNGLTPYEYLCKIWTSEPERVDPRIDPPDVGNKQVGPLQYDERAIKV